MTYKLFLHREECQSNTEQSWIVKNEQSKFFPSESLSLFQCFIENVWCLSGPRKCWVLHMWGRAVRADLIRIPLYWSLLAQLIETRGRKNISGVRPSWRSHSWHTQCRILASSFMNTACANSGGWHFSLSWPPSSGVLCPGCEMETNLIFVVCSLCWVLPGSRRFVPYQLLRLRNKCSLERHSDLRRCCPLNGQMGWKEKSAKPQILNNPVSSKTTGRCWRTLQVFFSCEELEITSSNCCSAILHLNVCCFLQSPSTILRYCERLGRAALEK